MNAFRIADSRFPVFDGTGARLAGGRWNSPGRPVIYTAQTYAGAMLEILVHANLPKIPATYSYTEIWIPDEASREHLPDTESALRLANEPKFSADFGDLWLRENRSAVLVVPSVVTGGVETNVLLNPLHADFEMVRANDPKPVSWDSRFFSRESAKTGPAYR